MSAAEPGACPVAYTRRRPEHTVLYRLVQAHLETSASAPGARTARDHWAILLARGFATVPLRCPQCGAQLRPIAFVTATEPVQRILTHLGEPAHPPRIAPARGPPA